MNNFNPRFANVFNIPHLPVTICVITILLGGLVVAARGALTESTSTLHRPDIANVESTQPRSLVTLAQQLSPTVVNIRVTRQNKLSGLQRQGGEETPFGELFRRFFEHGLPDQDKMLRRGAGSGVVISKDGHILTNHHVIDGATEVLVTTADQKTHAASITGSDPKTDLAVLKIQTSEGLSVAEMGDSERLMVGEWVMAIGNPFGLGHTVTTGIVSGKGRVIGAGPYDDFIQTDASINPGNSGGPLFNMKGELIGINTAIIPQGQGIGFAISINTAKPLIPQLMQHGRVTRGYLGVSIQNLSTALTKALQIDDDKGALVSDVVPESPADEAGIVPGDIIVAYAGKPIQTARHLPTLVANTPVGQEVTLTIVRQNQSHDIKLAVGQLPSAQSQPPAKHSSDKTSWGLYLNDLSPATKGSEEFSEARGVMVVGVEPDSPAQNAGIRRGDIIDEMNQQPVRRVQDIKTILAQSEERDTLLIRLRREDAKQYVALAK